MTAVVPCISNLSLVVKENAILQTLLPSLHLWLRVNSLVRRFVNIVTTSEQDTVKSGERTRLCIYLYLYLFIYLIRAISILFFNYLELHYILFIFLFLVESNVLEGWPQNTWVEKHDFNTTTHAAKISTQPPKYHIFLLQLAKKLSRIETSTSSVIGLWRGILIRWPIIELVEYS